ncbi:MAG: hypothetical protein RI898_747 [Actinomycetota bacterium]
MAITVTPETFSFVSFDSAYIARIATLVAEQLGLTDIDIEIAVDETSPLTRIDVEVTDSLISIRPLSGALEDTRRPRQQSELATTLAMARSMLRARDRLRGGFENAPLDTEECTVRYRTLSSTSRRMGYIHSGSHHTNEY